MPIEGRPFEPSDRGHILIVDDDTAFCKKTTALLRQEYYECQCVSNTAEALELLQTQPYQVLIADTQLSGDQDLAFLQAVISHAPTVRVILAATQPSLAYALAALRLPVVAYLVKPIAGAELLAAVRSGMTQARLSRAMGDMQQRLHEWSNDLQGMALATETELRTVSSSSYDTFVLLTLRHLVACVADLKSLADLAPAAHPNVPADALEDLSSLSVREGEVLRNLLAGQRVPTIARSLYLSPHTVRNHLKSIFRKIGVRSQTELLEHFARGTTP